jgi:hypothetical protein
MLCGFGPARGERSMDREPPEVRDAKAATPVIAEQRPSEPVSGIERSLLDPAAPVHDAVDVLGRVGDEGTNPRLAKKP